MAKLTEGALKNFANDKNYFYDDTGMWTHATSGHKLSDEGMAHWFTHGAMQSTPINPAPDSLKNMSTKEIINALIKQKSKAARGK